MAGTFTHWMVVEEAITKLPKETGDTRLELLRLKGKPYALLGAVSPDLPYLTDPVLDNFLKSHNWADRMHYENTGQFIINGMENLLYRSGDDFDLCYSWLFGYAAHVITDVVIHPVVNAIVGPYRFNATDHRECEMTQDSLIFSLWQEEDITNTKYHHVLLDASARPSRRSAVESRSIKKEVHNFWVETLKDTYPMASHKFDDIKPDEWFKNYIKEIGMSSKPNAVFRHLGEKLKVVYLSNEVLHSNKYTEQKKRYFDIVSIPGGSSASFLSIFRKASTHVQVIWMKMADDILRKDISQAHLYLKNWDLDQGLDMDNPALW